MEQSPESAAVTAARAARGGVQYHDLGAEYLAQRSLRRSATGALLWALGVGAVISYAAVMLSFIRLR